jgi:hypothetical protein
MVFVLTHGRTLILCTCQPLLLPRLSGSLSQHIIAASVRISLEYSVDEPDEKQYRFENEYEQQHDRGGSKPDITGDKLIEGSLLIPEVHVKK